MKCKVGSVVTIHIVRGGHCFGEGESVRIWDYVGGGRYNCTSLRTGMSQYVYESDLSNYSSNKTMNLSALAKRLLDKDTQLLVKAGLLDDNLGFTEEGMDLVNAMFLTKYKVELVKEAKRMIREKKEDCDDE